MKVELDRVYSPGEIEKERLVLNVRASTDIGDYALLQARYADDTLLSGRCEAYWFPFKAVNRDDLVVVYTKQGAMKEKEWKDGTKVHFFYWGLTQPIWNAEDRGLVILHGPTWEDKKQPLMLRASAKSSRDE